MFCNKVEKRLMKNTVPNSCLAFISNRYSIKKSYPRESLSIPCLIIDDPYQFLDQLPESCLKEIMDTERQRIPKEKSVEEVKPKVSTI